MYYHKAWKDGFGCFRDGTQNIWASESGNNSRIENYVVENSKH